MTAKSERVEGQTLAEVVLAALDRAYAGGAKPDWTEFVAAYEADLRSVANKLQRKYRGLHDLEPAEIVRAFLAEKVFPPQKARVLLGSVARGERPLKPRLLTSLGSYCVDLHRTGVRQPPTGEPVYDPFAGQNDRPAVEDVEGLVTRQLVAIRAVFDRTPTRAPYRAALLLHHRAEWAWVLSGVVLSGPGGHGEVTLSVERVVALTPWSKVESDQLLADDGDIVSLGLGWNQLQGLMGQPGQGLTGDLIAARIGIPRERWDAWISRGRHHLKTHLASPAKFGELFPTWVSNRA